MAKNWGSGESTFECRECIGCLSGEDKGLLRCRLLGERIEWDDNPSIAIYKVTIEISKPQKGLDVLDITVCAGSFHLVMRHTAKKSTK